MKVLVVDMTKLQNQHVAKSRDVRVNFCHCGMQASPIAAATSQSNVSVPLPKSKAVDNRTWAQRVSADGRKYFVDPVTRQTTWHDPVSKDFLRHMVTIHIQF